MNLIRKVCGMREADNIREVEQLPIDWMGFIFWESSKRYVAERPAYLPERVKRIGVFVDASPAFICGKQREYGLHGIQLHGSESPEFCNSLRETFAQLDTPAPLLIKAFSIGSESDFRRITTYDGCCDYFLFDTPCQTRGGSGKRFDWSLLNGYWDDTPFLLSGGIGPDSVEALHFLHHPRWYGIDVNSRFESAPGVKDPGMLSAFFDQIRNL